jgi:flagellar protein FliS
LSTGFGFSDNYSRASALRVNDLAYANYAFEYQKQAVTGASPVGLVVMLYDGALRFMEAGREAILAKDFAEQNRNLQRAQKIVLHLIGTLDHEKGGPIANNLRELYKYVLDQLVNANIHDQASRVDEAIKTFSQLREGWAELERQVKDKGQEQLVAA